MHLKIGSSIGSRLFYHNQSEYVLDVFLCSLWQGKEMINKAGFLLCWTLFATTNRRILWRLVFRLEGKRLSYLPLYKSSSDVKTKATYDALREGLDREKY